LRTTNIADPRAIEAFEWLADLFLVHNVVGAEGGGTNTLGAWINGQIGINLNWPHYLIGAGKDMIDEWDIEQIPTGPVGYKVARGATGGWAIPATAPNPDAAWELLKYLASFETQLRLISKGIGGVHLGAINEHWTR